jgi:hypothetical protein
LLGAAAVAEGKTEAWDRRIEWFKHLQHQFLLRSAQFLSPDTKGIGCGYFLATRKAPKNQLILGVAAAKATGNTRVI